ncbi:MAG: type II secretion system F family protein [Nautilia sp.]|nr:MAG: type II secretion system F family protein [Nautilia sp.]
MYFRVKYLKAGQEESTLIEAVNINEAINKFKAQNIGVMLGIDEAEEPLEAKLKTLLNKVDSFFNSSIDIEEYIAVLDQIYVMLDASMSLTDILQNVRENIKNKKLKHILTTISQDVESGLSISVSMKKFEKDLGKLSVAMIDLGEQTGLLSEAFKDLADILTEINENRKKLKSATKYPLFIIFAMSIAFAIVILFVIPPFKAIFAQLGTQLPLPTRFLLWLEWFLRTFGPYIIGMAIIVAVIINILYKKYEKVRLYIDKFMLKIFIVGQVIKFAMLGRFLYAFDKMVAAGIPILDALTTAVEIVDNNYLKQQLIKIKHNIAEGRGLAKGFEETEVFEKMIIQMIKSGEESGNLNIMLEKAANYYKNKYLYIVDNISTLLEPILIMGIAGFVTMLAFGIFLPMWGMADAVNK